VVTGVAPGNATITASFTAGGVTKTGSQVVSVQQPTSSANVEATTSNTFSPKSVAVARTGGIATVNWTFDALHTVTFDSGPQGADLAALSIGQQSSGSVGRNFTVAGDYAYHCLIHGASMNGTVHVQ
jgi:plastocyanin